jgi:hypothetical protein
MSSHEKYLELCAASTAGELSPDEQKILEEHLAGCASCRQAKHEFEITVQSAVPALVDEITPDLDEDDGPWSIEQAEKALFAQLDSERTRTRPAEPMPKPVSDVSGQRFAYRPSQIPWTELWMPIAACAILAVALGIVVYRSGVKRGADSAQQLIASSSIPKDSVEGQISDLGHERAQLIAKLADDDRTINEFKLALTQKTDEIKRLKDSASVAGGKDMNVGRAVAGSSSESSSSGAQLAIAQKNLADLQTKVDMLAREREESATRAEALEAKVEELTKLATDRGETVDQQNSQIARQQELLDHDRDIRELMGARDLYIAEIHDVAGTGETDKTYGRVFYTKGKSLIFYAYDLDQESGLKTASTFQAWGRRGVDKQQALSLGVFYQDNASKKRWVLKFDDPKALSSIDAVFVTVEPNGGSHHPSGKPLLFAYLRVNPNHP